MREEELKLEKVKKSCNITAKVSQVLEVILIVGAILCVVGAACCFGFKDEINSTISSSVDMSENFMTSFENSSDIGGLITFSFNPERMMSAGEYGQVAAIYCIFGGVICAMVAAVFDVIRRIFKIIKTSETPFTEAVLKKIRVLFIIISVEILLMVGLGDAAIVALICWSIYNILDYGFTLQKQVDETL